MIAPATPAGLLAADCVEQLRDLCAQVERHGIELGTLTAAMLALIDRHAEEAAPLVRADGGAADPGLLAQLDADHATLREFFSPLTTLRQFHDRLRQRLEHLEGAVERIASGDTPSAEADRRRLFPFEEEQRVWGEGDVPEPSREPELF